MSLLRLTAKINADASQFHAAAKGVEARATSMGKLINSQLKSAFLYFAGFSGFSRMVRHMSEVIENIDEMRPRIEELGIVIDDALVENAKRARAEWEQLTTSITVGLLPAFVAVVSKGAELFYGFKAMVRTAQQFTLGNLLTTSPKETYDNLVKIQQDLEADLLRMSSATPATKAVKKTKDEKEKSIKAAVADAVQESAPQMFSEALAKIGGFTGRSEEELKSLEKRMAEHLKNIESNTAPLKRGIA